MNLHVVQIQKIHLPKALELAGIEISKGIAMRTGQK